MATLKNPETGEEVEIKPVEAVAVAANVSATSTAFVRGDAAFIQAFMTKAVEDAYREGKTDPDYVRNQIYAARELAKHHLKRIKEEARLEAERAAKDKEREDAERNLTR